MKISLISSSVLPVGVDGRSQQYLFRKGDGSAYDKALTFGTEEVHDNPRKAA
jgi:hypothetical protein